MTNAQKFLSLLNLDNRKEVNEMIIETIESYKNNEINADRKIEFLFEKLQLDDLDEGAKNEIKSELLRIVKSDAGYHLKSDYLWSTNTKLAPLEPSIKETLAQNIVGPDSNRVGDIYSRKKDDFGIYHQEPKPKKQNKDELDIQKKLEALKKLFNSRNQQKITLSDIKKILQSESIEERSNVKSKMLAASALINEEPEIENELIEHYFFQGNILNESSGGSSSSTSWSNWSMFKYIKVNKTGLVVHSNSFLCQAGTILTKEKQVELEGMGVKIYFSEGLNETLFSIVAKAKTGNQTAKISLPVSAEDEREAESKFKEMTRLQIRNGHLPKDTKITDIKVFKTLSVSL